MLDDIGEIRRSRDAFYSLTGPVHSFPVVRLPRLKVISYTILVMARLQ